MNDKQVVPIGSIGADLTAVSVGVSFSRKQRDQVIQYQGEPYRGEKENQMTITEFKLLQKKHQQEN